VTNTPSGFLPGALDLLILKALVQGGKHGYGIVSMFTLTITHFVHARPGQSLRGRAALAARHDDALAVGQPQGPSGRLAQLFECATTPGQPVRRHQRLVGPEQRVVRDLGAGDCQREKCAVDRLEKPGRRGAVGLLQPQAFAHTHTPDIACDAIRAPTPNRLNSTRPTRSMC
jgi:hypothetical protein